jgi:hypothetical protein
MPPNCAKRARRAANAPCTATRDFLLAIDAITGIVAAGHREKKVAIWNQ